MAEIPKESIDCAVQHYKVLLLQAREKRKASVAEACATCPIYAEKHGRCDWKEMFEPLLANSNIMFSMKENEENAQSTCAGLCIDAERIAVKMSEKLQERAEQLASTDRGKA